MTVPEDTPGPPIVFEDPCRDYWGPWQTLGFVLVILVVTEVVLTLGVGRALLFLPRFMPSLVHRPSPLDPWVNEGGFVSLLAPLKVLLGVLFVAAVARLRKVPFARFAALRLPPAPAILRWAALTGVLVVVIDLLRVATGRPVANEWVDAVYRSAPSLPLFVVAVVVAAPIYEELVFRGLLLPGLACSRLGPRWAVLATSVLFALLHMQYDWFDVLSVLALGVLLGMARVAGASTGLTILLHALVNAIALVEVWVRINLLQV